MALRTLSSAASGNDQCVTRDRIERRPVSEPLGAGGTGTLTEIGATVAESETAHTASVD
jgi:hypothetical protein